MKQSFRQPPSPSARQSAPQRAVFLLLAAAFWAGGLAAAEVYTWTDENGVTHFSQTPREQGETKVIEAQEAYKPGSVEVQPPTVDAAGGDGDGDGEMLSPAEARRQELDRERQERREQRAQTEQLCTLHRQRLEQIEPARRVFYTDESGETVRMDDERRVALIEESKIFLADNCDD